MKQQYLQNIKMKTGIRDICVLKKLNLRRTIAIVLSTLVVIASWADVYPAKCTIGDTTSDKAIVSLGYTNFGTEEEQEWVWTIFCMTGETDEVDHMFFFSQHASWDHNTEHPFLKGSDIALLRDIYAIQPAGRNQDIVEISTYGSNIQGIFTPNFIHVGIYSAQGKPKFNYWIEYSEEIRKKIYGEVTEAIEILNIPHAQ